MLAKGDAQGVGVPLFQVAEEDLPGGVVEEVVSGVDHGQRVVDPVVPPVGVVGDGLDVEGAPVGIVDDVVGDVCGVQGGDQGAEDRGVWEGVVLHLPTALVVGLDGGVAAVDGAVEEGCGFSFDAHGSCPFGSGGGVLVMGRLPDPHGVRMCEERAEDVGGHPFGVEVLGGAPVEAAVGALEACEVVDGCVVVLLPGWAGGVLVGFDKGAGRPGGGGGIGGPPGLETSVISLSGFEVGEGGGDGRVLRVFSCGGECHDGGRGGVGVAPAAVILLVGEDVGFLLLDEGCLWCGAAGDQGEDAEEVVVEEGGVSNLCAVVEAFQFGEEVCSCDCGGVLAAGDQGEGLSLPVCSRVVVEEGEAVDEVGGEAGVCFVGGGVGHGCPC